MSTRVVSALTVCLVFAGSARAVEGVVSSFENGKVTIKAGMQTVTYEVRRCVVVASNSDKAIVDPTFDVGEKVEVTGRAKTVVQIRKLALKVDVEAERKADAEARAKAEANAKAEAKTRAFLNVRDLRVGQEGQLPRKTSVSGIEVLQVLEEDEALVYFASRGQVIPRTTATFLLRGVSTKDWADGMKVQVDGLFSVSGTYKYATANNSIRTVLVVEPVQEPGKVQP